MGGEPRVHALPLPRAEACPLRTAQAWQSFLVSHAGDERWTETCEDSTCDARYYAFVKREIAEVFETCEGFLSENPVIARCTAHYREFVPAWLRQHDAVSYGFDVDNSRYLAAQEAFDKPAGMMRPPEAIVAALPSRTSVEEAARRGGLRYLTHDSAIDGIRTFVFNPDPKGRYDQWLLLNLRNPTDTAIDFHTPLSVLAVQKTDANGHRLPQVRLHFRDYQLEAIGGRYRLTLNQSGNGKCYSCHANGVRQLIARRTPVLMAKPSKGEPGYREIDDRAGTGEFAYARLMEFNKRLRSYGSPDWSGQIRPSSFGPALGQAEGCVDCHDGKTRGILNIATSTTQLEKKIFYELSMPYDNDLSPLVERKEMKNPRLTPGEIRRLRKAYEAHQRLAIDYEKSRLPELRRWLLETPCG